MEPVTDEDIIMPDGRLYYLFTGWLRNSLSELERDEFFKLVTLPENRSIFESWIEKELFSPKKELELSEPVTSSILTAIINTEQDADNSEVPVVILDPVMPFFRYNWWKWAAAAVFLFLITGIYFLIQYRSIQRQEVISVSSHLPKGISPGRQGAILTLSDGKQVVLDSLGNGIVAKQNGTQVILRNGQLAYNPVEKSTSEIVYNTMSTPKGRQFQVTLPDGTRVWLNSASSVTYPTVFVGNERKVKVTGEVYFEVAHLFSNGGRKGEEPVSFKVEINNQAEVEVLGTHFNINAYQDESIIKTTLLEGSVKITDGSEKALLQPGQQAQVAPLGKIRIVKDVDIEKIMAWRKGLFDFEGLGIEEVMRQLSRWYDIEVVYEKGVPDIKFVGEMSKNVNLSDLLNGLKGIGVHFRIEGERRLIILPK